MGVIKLLPKETIDKIAAGEVVVNAASVIKELLENSIDAGAKHIYVLTREGGKKLIRVIDDGCGMLKEDLPLAFTRNATSKIYDDISSISSLGFRGEALSSISYVSNVTVTTRNAAEEIGTRAEVYSNEIVSYEAISCSVGTTIEVTDLFYNFPARLKHLGTDVAENREITEITSRVAMSHPEISFTLACDDRNIFSTAGTGNMLAAINSVLGRKVSEGLMEIRFENRPLAVHGYISSPNFINAKNSEHIVFLNGRYIKSDVITKAVDQVYADYYGKTGATYILYIDLPYQMIDVNIHPAKTTVKFLNESLIVLLIKQGIRDFLRDAFVIKENVKEEEPSETDPFGEAERKAAEHPAFEEKSPILPEEPEKGPSAEPVKEEKITERKDREPPPVQKSLFETENFRPQTEERIDAREKETGYDNGSDRYEKPSGEENVIPAKDPATSREELNKEIFLKVAGMRHVGNAFGLYAMMEDKDSMYVIDTHAAHERVLYERYRDDFLNRQVTVQDLLIPVTMDLTRREFGTVMDNLDLFASLGFAVEEFSDSGIIIRSIPSYLSGADIALKVGEMITTLLNGSSREDIEHRNDVLIKNACHNAVRGKENLTTNEVIDLLKDLYRCEMPFTCPHGRPVIGKMSEKYFMKMFERIR